MANLTADMIAKMCDFRQDRIDAFTADLNAGAAVDAISTTAQALSLTRILSELTVSGTMTGTLAAPTYVGQKKVVRCVSAASTPKFTLTISSPDDTTGFVCSATFIFDNVGQEITLEATSALKWRCVGVKRAGGAADAVVVGTTVLTGYNLWKRYCLSVDGTKSSTTTKGIPNGNCVGERCIVTNSTASNTPIGDISGSFVGMNGTAYTSIGAIGVAATASVTGDYAHLEWNGAAWAVLTMNGVTLA